MIPDDIDGPNTKLIFLYIKHTEKRTEVDEIADNLNLRKLTVIPIMRRLCDSGYIEKIDRLSYEICDELEN